MVHANHPPEPESSPLGTPWGEPLMPVPKLGRHATGLVPVRWVRSVVLLTVGTTLIVSQLVMWMLWQRDPVLAFLTVGAGLMGMPMLINLDERRQDR